MASTPSIFDSVKTFAIVAVVTLLVWLLAEAESLRTDKVQVHVTFRTQPDSGRLVRLDAPAQDFTGTVTLRLEGPTARVDTLASSLKKEITLEPGNEGVPADQGKHSVSLQAALRAIPAIRDSGVTITDADPPTAQIVVENIVQREAKVRVEIPDGQFLETAAEPTPSLVKLRLPEPHARSLPADLTLVARLDPDTLRSLPEGQRTSINVPVELPESLRAVEGVHVDPSSVKVALTLRARTDSVTLPAVPVHLRLAPTELDLWDIQVPETSRQLTDVTITGPSDRIAEIRSGSSKPIAYVPLSFEELEKAAASGQPLDKEPVFTDLPTALKFEVKQRTIRLIIRRRESPGPVTPLKTPS